MSKSRCASVLLALCTTALLGACDPAAAVLDTMRPADTLCVDQGADQCRPIRRSDQRLMPQTYPALAPDHCVASDHHRHRASEDLLPTLMWLNRNQLANRFPGWRPVEGSRTSVEPSPRARFVARVAGCSTTVPR